MDAGMANDVHLPTTITKLQEEKNENFVTSDECEGGYNSYSILCKDEEKHLNATLLKGGTERNYEHEYVIREIETMLFCEDEIEPQHITFKHFIFYRF